MKLFVVGLDGDHTPDPVYWRERWGLVEAEDRHDAKEQWIAEHQGWLQLSELKHIFTDEVESPVNPRTYQRKRR